MSGRDRSVRFQGSPALTGSFERQHIKRTSFPPPALTTAKAERATSWRTWVEVVIKAAADCYYNTYPVASILLLRGAFTDDDRDAHAAKNETIGQLLGAKTVSLGQLPTLPTTPDAAAIAVELAFACMKYGYLQECKVSSAIRREATHAVIAYLEQWDTAV
jgi:hypothetical protein